MTKRSTIPRVVHLGIQVSNMQRSVDFYSKLLGLDKIPVMEGSLGPMGFIVIGGFELVLHHIPGEMVEKRNRLDHFGIQVDDLAATYARAHAMGVVKDDIHDSFQWRQFNVVDPDGYPIHIMSLTKDHEGA
jgi:catechol 2,3-dioxygenase-like lactoylglutathione lyase family enzyme